MGAVERPNPWFHLFLNRSISEARSTHMNHKRRWAMKSIRPRRLHFAVCIIFLAAWLYPPATFAETCEQWIAKAVSVQGVVEVQRAGESQWQAVKLDDTFCPGDTIRVDDRSRADLSLVNQPVLRLDQNTCYWREVGIQ